MPISRPVRRTKRAHGVRKQDAEAKAQFEYHQKKNPVAPSGFKVEVLPACTCDGRSVPHVHGEYERQRFDREMKMGRKHPDEY